MGAERADLQRLDRQLEIIEGRRGAREMQHPIDGPLELDVLRDVVLDECKSAAIAELREILARAGDEVVHADDVAPVLQQEFAEVRADEARRARDEYAHASQADGRMGLRPTEWYSKPSRRIRSGSQRLRPSNTSGRCITERNRSRLRNLNSFHSVTSAAASAPRAASYGES